MNSGEVLRRRIAKQRLARAAFRRPEDCVAWFGAVQAQDYLGALWGIGQRCSRTTEADVELAETRRTIVRTWPMRGTLHFVAAADVRWMTQLLAPRVIARNAARWKREFDVDARMIDRSRTIVTRALEGGTRLTRSELYERLEARRIRTGNSRGLHILLCLAMDGTLCLAGRSAKQHTFALLDEWLPPTRTLERDAALARLAARYFASHGPATLKDFAWWSGLTLRDARGAVDGATKELERIHVEGAEYWETGGAAPRPNNSPHVLLLPAYDEYTVAYEDRTMLAPATRAKAAIGFGLLSPVIVVDGRVAGHWTRALTQDLVRVQAKMYARPAAATRARLLAETRRYARFLGREAKLSCDA